MQKVSLGSTGLSIPDIAVGCMRISEMEDKALSLHLNTCIEQGLNFFDHADIYGNGLCESRFSRALKDTGFQRKDIVLQSKCGIVPGVMYDFSKEHILNSVDGILKRLDTDYLDILLLHRPDALMEPEEVAEAFDVLQSSGKVKYFGVSNQRPMQIELLKKCVEQELLVNQLQMSIPVSQMIAGGLEVNMMTEGAVDRDGSVLEYCRIHDMVVQAWSPFQYGFFEGIFLNNREQFSELNQCLDRLAERYGTTPTAVATAWILRYPARMQVIAGTTNTDRMKEIMKGSELELSREEWYELYLSTGHILP